MAISPEQVQELLARLATTEQRLGGLENELHTERTRATNAEAERSALIRAMEARTEGNLVGTKGLGQPFKLSGDNAKDEDIAEWCHKVRTFARARFGDEFLPALQWAARQKQQVAEENPTQSTRITTYKDKFGADADALEQIQNLHKIVGQLYTYLVAFTTGGANSEVRNAGDGAGLEAWRRLHAAYDPASSSRRVAILGRLQNPSRCQKVEDIGHTLGEWLALKRQYESFTDRDGRECTVGEDSLIAAMHKLMPKALEDQIVLSGDDGSFEDLFDRLMTFSSNKAALKLTQSSDKRHDSRKDDPMNVGTAWGKRQRARRRQSRQAQWRNKGQDRKSYVHCWACNQFGHYGRECPKREGSKGG